MKYSVTFTGLILVVLSFALDRLGVHIADANLQTTLETLMQIAGAVLVWYGRFRHGDVNILGVKK